MVLQHAIYCKLPRIKHRKSTPNVVPGVAMTIAVRSVLFTWRCYQLLDGAKSGAKSLPLSSDSSPSQCLEPRLAHSRSEIALVTFNEPEPNLTEPNVSPQREENVGTAS